MVDELRADVVVVGAGITGLLICRGLARVGYGVILVEPAANVGAGATTRNEGWLHHGSYHANSVANRTSAIMVAKRCLYGSEVIKRLAPEAIEEPFLRTFAVTTRAGQTEEFEDRWRQAGVRFRRLSIPDIRSAVPSLRCDDIAGVYEVADTPVNTRVLCAVLLRQLKALGVRVVPGGFISSWKDSGGLWVSVGGSPFSIRTRLVVAATGYGLGDLAKTLGLRPRPIRLWKSHLLVVRRLLDHCVFSLDPGEVALMNHQFATVVGLNEDARRVDSPSIEPEAARVAEIWDALTKRFDITTPQRSAPVACIKIDIPSEERSPRSLAPNLMTLSDRVLAVLPGKMSEAPYIVDRVVPLLTRKLGLDQVAARPCDAFQDPEREWLEAG